MKLPYPTEEVPDPRKTTVGFSVTAVQKTPRETTLQSVLHYNIQVTNVYDSCKSEIKLSWHRYRGWSANTRPNKPLEGYHLIRIPDGGGAPELVKNDLLPDDTTWTVKKVDDNKIYHYYIEARRNGETATCLKTTRSTNMPVTPTFITAESTQYNKDGLAEISFKIDPNAETHRYYFYGTSRPDFTWPELGRYDIYGDTVLTDIKIRQETYYYRLEAQHIYECRGSIFTSNMATALWLKLKQEESVNVLNWYPYLDWGEDAHYEIYRKIGNADSMIITNIYDPAKTAFDDDMTNVLIDGDVCYWIVATPTSKAAGKKAMSNRQCIIPESNIWIPDAFTPNVAGINAEFKPFFSYPPSEYIFYVYDLNGAKVFETKDINAGWDGRLLNGKPAREGVYVYHLKYKTEQGRAVEKKGTFALVILP
jgi:gliding motility-associated-like protein